jgi:hypothetical protein
MARLETGPVMIKQSVLITTTEIRNNPCFNNVLAF